MQDYSIAHVIGDLGARHRLCVCSVQGKRCCCVGGGGTAGPPRAGLRSWGVRRNRGALIRDLQKAICMMSKRRHQFPLPDEHKGKSPIILHIMRRSLKEGLEFGRAKWESSCASILHWETSLFSYVVMNEVLALGVLSA